MRLIETFENREYIVDNVYVIKREAAMLRKYQIKQGSLIKVIKKHKVFPMIIEIEGNRVAFSRRLAFEIQVTPYV